MDQVRVRPLGGFGVRVGSREITEGEWRLRKARALVKLLALAPGHALLREQVVDRLWPPPTRTCARRPRRSSNGWAW
jgi:DNA-binding SARP family transcriptional activator